MDESKQAIMDATFTALCSYGYAELSIQKIADEFDKGKSLIYYHFENKEELMLAFLDHMGDHIREDHRDMEDLDSEERLDRILEKALGVSDDEQWEFQKAFLELRAQASQRPEFAEKFSQIDSEIKDYMRETLEQLDAEEPEMTADILISCIEGSLIRKVSTGDRQGLRELKHSIKAIAERHIVEGCGDCG